MPDLGSAQYTGVVKRLDEVAGASALPIASTVTPSCDARSRSTSIRTDGYSSISLSCTSRKYSSLDRLSTMRRAWASLSARAGPATAISIGVGAPKLITWLTRSGASKAISTPGAISGMRRRSSSSTLAVGTPESLLSAMRMTASCGPPVHSTIRLTGKLDGCTPTKAIDFSTCSGPTISPTVASTFCAISSVRSTRVPDGARTRIWSELVSTRGKISVPKPPPTKYSTAPAPSK